MSNLLANLVVGMKDAFTKEKAIVHWYLGKFEIPALMCRRTDCISNMVTHKQMLNQCNRLVVESQSNAQYMIKRRTRMALVGVHTSTRLDGFTFCIPPIGRICIRTSTKICSCHLPNQSNKFCLNTTFGDIVLCIVFGPSMVNNHF